MNYPTIYFNGTGEMCVSGANPDGTTWSMLKSAYDGNRTDTPTQAELDAIAKAEADAKAQADAQKASEVAFQTQLAATNQKLMALGLTATDIGTLLSAAKN